MSLRVSKNLALLGAVVLIVFMLGTVNWVNAEPQLQTDVLVDNPSLFTQIYNDVSPSVVAINVTARREGSGFFNQDNTVIASGSGFVIDEEGHIITNNHVVDGATRIEINFLDGTITRAEIVGLDPDSDLAVLDVELPEEKLHPVTFGDSDALQIGEPVLAIGSPFGQRWTLTSGIVSAVDRTIQGLTNFSIGGVIQTDAPINPGNSGGPLFNLKGEVVGVNSQIISASRSSAGIGFSIPSNLAQRVARELIDNGFVSYSFLGIGGSDITLPIIEALGLPNDMRGVVVGSVEPGGPAARAGLREPSTDTVEIDGQPVPTSVDIITAINGEPLRGMADLIAYLGNNTQPGDTVTLTILRDGDEFDTDVRLIPRP
ncbi:MAG: PDZ domain-containing protein [Chloroflexi bacterium]|nr:MAG: PDZ domain-containing protein [Chloroflexota bacterium]